jgi:hypothetical protein
MVVRTQVFGKNSRVIVDINAEQARRVFIRFADVDAKKRAQKVYGVAYAEAPDNTGYLKSQLRVARSRDVRGRYETGWDVQSNAPYSLYVIKGTRPHKITGNPLLGFFWPKVGQFVVFHSVNHPGTKANNFLSRALRAAR